MAGLILRYQDILLRDRVSADLKDHQRWFTTENAWMDWDAPWEELSPSDAETMLVNMARRLTLPAREVRSALEICTAGGVHIGVVNSYYIDNNPLKLAVGIGIRETSQQNKGLGRQAFALWLAYLFSATGRERLYCETWSGNSRMVKLAESCSLALVESRKEDRLVRGNRYDSLTFVVTIDIFKKHFSALMDIAGGRPD